MQQYLIASEKVVQKGLVLMHVLWRIVIAILNVYIVVSCLGGKAALIKFKNDG